MNENELGNVIQQNITDCVTVNDKILRYAMADTPIVTDFFTDNPYPNLGINRASIEELKIKANEQLLLVVGLYAKTTAREAVGEPFDLIDVTY